jgi:hypothetical protein
MKKLLTLVFVFTLFSTQFIAQTKKELKAEEAQKEYEMMKSLINSKEYVFDATWISTTRGRRINISGGSNSITVKQDSTEAAMQFFGEVYSIRNSSEGVAFDNVIENYKVEFNDKKRRITISYNVKNKSETYGVLMSVSKTGYCYVDVFSNNKSNVTYDGNVSAIKNE